MLFDRVARMTLGIVLLVSCACTERSEGLGGDARGDAASADVADGDTLPATDTKSALNGDALAGSTAGTGFHGISTPGSMHVPNVILSPPTSERLAPVPALAPTPPPVSRP